ncbi:MAG: hypothetical protein HY898_02260 [Deltaproteobacteria bacterium]|nr:hypothetical protein [Deltaproteobacteria bacterium]
MPGTVAGQLARLQLGAVVRVVARDPAREVFGRVLEVQSHALTLRPLGWLRDESLTVLADVIERVEPAPLDERAFRMIASRQQAARKEEHRGT